MTISNERAQTILASEADLPSLSREVTAHGFFEISAQRYIRLSDGHRVTVQVR
jgi:hypothetical protein